MKSKIERLLNTVGLMFGFKLWEFSNFLEEKIEAIEESKGEKR